MSAWLPGWEAGWGLCCRSGCVGLRQVFLLQATRPLSLQVSLLGKVCFPPSSPALPSGVQLLDRLLDVSVHVSSEQVNHNCHSPDLQVHLLLVSLLRAAAAPYFRFLQKWIFEGEVSRPSW